MVIFRDYLEYGWALTPLRPSSKKPYLINWSQQENAIRGSLRSDELGQSAGLLLAHCSPPLMTLDVDDFHNAATFLDGHGIDLAHLIQRDDAVQISSGRENRAKLLYTLEQSCVSHRVTQGRDTILEFRCADRNGGSVQDVLPPSTHPETRQPYVWKGDWWNVPKIPDNLNELWQSLVAIPSPTEETEPLGREELARLQGAFNCIDPDIGYCEWLKIGQALHDGTKGSTVGLGMFREWSQKGYKFKSGECEEKWRTFEPGKGIGLGSLFHIARAYGWEDSRIRKTSMASDNPFGIRNMKDVKIKKVDWLWEEMLARGKVHLLSGNGGRGKTTLMLSIAAKITSGQAFPGQSCDRKPGSVLYISAEDSIEDTLLPRFLAAGGDRILFYAPERLIQENSSYLSILDHTQMLADCVRSTGSIMIVFDPGTAFCGTNIDNNNATQIRSVMARLQEIAELTGVAVVVLNHMTKSNDTAPVNRVLGSGAWVHASRLVWGVAEEQDGMRILGLLKSNLGPIEHVYPYHLKSSKVDSVPAQWASIGGRIPGEVFSNYSDFEGKSHGRKRTEAEVYLRECLSDGPKKKKAVLSGSELSPKTIERAVKEIGVVSKRDSSVHGEAIWSLPRKIT